MRDAIDRVGIVEILDEEIDLATGRVGGVVERGPDVAAVVVENQVDRQATGGENEAVSNLAAHEAGGLEGHARLLGQIRERDRVAAGPRAPAPGGGGRPRGGGDPDGGPPAP